jgi:hypothetical protein
MRSESVIEWYTKRDWNDEEDYKTKYHNFQFFEIDQIRTTEEH